MALASHSGFTSYARTLGRILLLVIHAAQEVAKKGNQLLPVSLSPVQLRVALQLFDALEENSEDVGKELNFDTDEDDDDGYSSDGDDKDEEEMDEDILEDEVLGFNGSSRRRHQIPPVSKVLTSLVHTLTTSLFATPIVDEDTNHPVAVLAMFWSQTDGGRMRPAREISSFLVKIQYNIRLTVYAEAIRLSKRDQLDLETTLHPLRHWLDEREKTIFRWVRNGISNSAKACIHDHRLPNIIPLDSGGTLWSYRSQVLSLRKYKEYCASLPDACWNTLGQLFAGVEWKDIVDKLEKRPDGWGLQDDVSCEGTGYSVFEDPANGVHGLWEILLRRMIQAGRFHSWIINDDSGQHELCWNVAAIVIWLQLADQLCQELHLASFESFAAPPRSSEFSSTLIRNIPGRLRNIFKINDIITIILKYNKTSTQTGMDNPIARSLPFVLQQLLGLYITVIKRLVWFFAVHVLKLQPQITSVLATHLWALHNGRVLDSEDLTKNMKQGIEPVMGSAVAKVYNVRGNRHFKKALGRRCMENHPTAKLMNESSLKLFESQSGHSQAIADMFYARLGGLSFHPTISPRILRQHQILGQIMHSVFGFERPPGGNLELELAQPPDWVFQPYRDLLGTKGDSFFNSS